jgi:hypothetical protein
MIALSALAAFSLISFPGAQTSGMVTLAGRVVPIVYPSGEVVQVPAEVQQWDGFKGANATGADWPTAFEAPGNWSAVRAKLEALGPMDKSAPVWRTKVFVLTQTDVMAGSSEGGAYQSRIRLREQQVDAILRSIARIQGYIRAATNGAANWAFDVEIERDPIIFGNDNARGFLSTYAHARVNRGSFEAEDKVFRGPYHTVLFISAEQSLTNNIAPNVGLARIASGIDDADGFGMDEPILRQLGYNVHQNWTNLDVYHPPSEGGAAGLWIPFWPRLLDEGAWKVLAKPAEPTAEELASFIQIASRPSAEVANPIGLPNSSAPYSANVSISIAEDPDRGKVLQYVENSTVRFGGFALPYAGNEIAKSPYLRFWVKSSSPDPIWIQVQKMNKGSFFVPAKVPMAAPGQWRQVVVNLAKGGNDLQSQLKMTGKLVIGPLHERVERRQVGPVTYLFDDFELLTEGESTPVDVNLALEPASNAAELAKQPEHTVIAGLSQKKFAASDEPALIDLTKSVNVRIAGLAVQRLAELGTPTGKAEILRLITASPFEHVKQVAAIEVGKLGDAKDAPVLSRLFGSRSWQTRMAGAAAVNMLPGDQAAVIAMTFLQENDPMVRLAATQGARVENPTVLRRLLWSAVNDPSDAVRAESAWKLINSGKEKEVAEGYKSVRDDSVGVRLELLQRLSSNPAESHRGALRIAVVDLSARIRAAALNALAKQPGEVVLDEVSNTFNDKFPIVQLALLDLARTKNLKLPANAVENLRASIDPRVVDRAKGLG